MIRMKPNESIFAKSFSKFARFVRIKRFMQFVTVGGPNECWGWQGAKFGVYGSFSWDEKSKGAHVAAYLLFIGKIPRENRRKKFCVCHSCDNPLCVNPSHLWLGSQKQNVADMDEKGRRNHLTGGRGERNGNAKMTLEKVEKIRKLHTRGYSQIRLAKKFGISHWTVSQIVNYETWVQ